MNRPRTVLYLDIDGVLQYADGNCWRPRLEAEDFLKWAVARFECRWLTNWADPNRTIPKDLGITVPPGIIEVRWREMFAGDGYPFKAAAVRDDESWLWLEDEPSEFDLADLKRRRKLDNLIRVDPIKPYILLSQICEILEDRLDYDEMGL
jgi:hypothetical protein